MKYCLSSAFGAFSCIFLAASGCIVSPVSDLDQAIDDSKAALGDEYDADLALFATLGLPSDQLDAHSPVLGADQVQLYGEASAMNFSRDKLKGTVKNSGDHLREVQQNGVIAGIEDLERGLVVFGQTEQTDPVLNQPAIRFRYLQLGYRVGHVLCLSNIHKELDPNAPLPRVRCDLTLDFGTIWESYAFQSMLFTQIQGTLKTEGAAVTTYLNAINTVVRLATPTDGSAAPDYIKTLSAKAAELAGIIKTRTTPATSFGSMVRQGVATGAGAAAGAAAIIGPLSPQGTHHADEAAALTTALDSITSAQTDLDSAMSGYVSIGALPQDALDGLGAAVGGASDAIGAAAGGGGQDELLNATKNMTETQMSFNLQYLQLQSQMQDENRQYTTISNVLKTKHDTVKNSINNVR